MQYTTTILLLVLISACATAQPQATTTFVTWDHKEIDLGQVKKGEKREMDFTLTNTSGQDVKIDLVDACECTTTDYPRGVIAAGKTATVHAVFDSTQKDEDETISIRVIIANTDAEGNPRIETVRYKFGLVK